MDRIHMVTDGETVVFTGNKADAYECAKSRGLPVWKLARGLPGRSIQHVYEKLMPQEQEAG
jgi:hypothetical protein